MRIADGSSINLSQFVQEAPGIAGSIQGLSADKGWVTGISQTQGLYGEPGSLKFSEIVAFFSDGT